MEITLEQILSALPLFDLESRIEIAKAALNADEEIQIDPSLVAHAEQVAQKIRTDEMKTMSWEDHQKNFEAQKQAYFNAREAN